MDKIKTISLSFKTLTVLEESIYQLVGRYSSDKDLCRELLTFLARQVY